MKLQIIKVILLFCSRRSRPLSFFVLGLCSDYVCKDTAVFRWFKGLSL